MGAFFSWLGSLIAGPLVDAYKARLAAGNEHDRMAADLAAKEIEARRAIVVASLSHWFTALPIVTISMTFALYIAKLVVWDKMLGLGSTDPLTGDLREWANTVIGGMFGYGGVALAARAWARR